MRLESDVFRNDIVEYYGKLYTVISDMSSNNGNFKAVDKDGRIAHINLRVEDVKIIKRA